MYRFSKFHFHNRFTVKSLFIPSYTSKSLLTRVSRFSHLNKRKCSVYEDEEPIRLEQFETKMKDLLSNAQLSNIGVAVSGGSDRYTK